MVRFFTLVTFLLFISLQTYSQTATDTQQLFSGISFYENRDSTNLCTYKHQNFFLFLYKKYISSQDAQACSFSPSCSVYGAESVRKKGLIKGFLNTFDRLSRCNSAAHHLYPIDPHTQLYYDPVE